MVEVISNSYRAPSKSSMETGGCGLAAASFKGPRAFVVPVLDQVRSATHSRADEAHRPTQFERTARQIALQGAGASSG
jgi:hypothetical protein